MPNFPVAPALTIQTGLRALRTSFSAVSPKRNWLSPAFSPEPTMMTFTS